jgi:hypothetical protein
MVSNGARIVKSLNLVQYSHYYSPLTGFLQSPLQVLQRSN